MLNGSEEQGIRTLLTIDHSIMQTVGKFGHLTISGLLTFMPDSRAKNTVYQRARYLRKIGFLEAVLDRKKNQIFRLSAQGVQELSTDGVRLRGRGFLHCDMARMEWAMKQSGYMETLGLQALPTTQMLDAVSKGEPARALIVDNPNQHSANTQQRIQEFVKATGSTEAPLDIVVLNVQRKEELMRYIQTSQFKFSILLYALDL